MKRNILIFLAFCCVVALCVYFIIDSSHKNKLTQDEEVPASSMLVFQAENGDNTVSFDPDAFSDYIVMSDDQYEVFELYENDGEDKIAIRFMVESDTTLKDLESIILIYEDFQDDVDLFDALVQVKGITYEIIDGLDILRHSISFVTYPILDGYLERLDTLLMSSNI